jgi:glycosyltransferase involved in cell wall biosynthesis
MLRTRAGYLLLDRAGLSRFHDILQGVADPGPAHLLARLFARRAPLVLRAEQDLRRRALARATRLGLARMLRRHMPSGYRYFNVGHSHLTARMLGAVRRSAGQSEVMIHDLIPIDHPALQRPGTAQIFARKLRIVRRGANRVWCISQHSAARLAAHWQDGGDHPPVGCAYLGVETVPPQPNALGDLAVPKRPYFICVGTIEPRKNHAFLLDLWEKLGPDAPPLLICGARGWNNRAVFDRLDALGPDHPIRELSGLSDPALSALVQGASGCLFPSLAEGFGLPPVEALALGTRVLCNDLPVFHEILGPKAQIIPISEGEKWLSKIRAWEKNQPDTGDQPLLQPPSWDVHFKTVLSKS